MATSNASIRIFRGDPVANPAEIACARRLEHDLGAEGVDAVLLANFTLGPRRRQIDLIVATAATAIVVEIKNYIHSVHGGVNGPWWIEKDNGSRCALDGSNPYQQALENRFAVTDMVRELVRAVLAKSYVAVSAFARFQFGRSLEDDHIDAALQLMAKVGRSTDLKLVHAWLDHPRHGERALATARALEADRIGQQAARASSADRR